jgi:hypothetical protein
MATIGRLEDGCMGFPGCAAKRGGGAISVPPRAGYREVSRHQSPDPMLDGLTDEDAQL